MISRKQPNSDRRPVHGGSPGSNVRPPAAAFYHAGCAAHLLRPELILGTGICFAASAAPLIIAPWPCRASPGREVATTIYECLLNMINMTITAMKKGNTLTKCGEIMANTFHLAFNRFKKVNWGV